MNNMVWHGIIKPHNVYGRGRIFGIVTGMYWEFGCIIFIRKTYYNLQTEQTRAFSYIDDSLEPLWNSAENAAAEIINLGALRKLREAARVLSDITGGVEINYLEARHEVKHAWEKSADILDFNIRHL